MDKNQIKNKPDLAVGFGIIVFSVIIYFQTLDLDNLVRLLPRVVLFISLLMGIGIIITAFITSGGNAKKHGLTVPKLTLIKTGLLVFIFGMLMLVRIIGIYTCIFLINSAIILTITCVEYGLNRKKLLRMLLYNFIVTVVVFVLFNIVLGVLTPEGLLF